MLKNIFKYMIFYPCFLDMFEGFYDCVHTVLYYRSNAKSKSKFKYNFWWIYIYQEKLFVFQL